MDELTVVTKAREFLAKVGPLSLPIAVDAYAIHVGGKVKPKILSADEDAWSFRKPSGQWHICVNCAHKPRRQRFSVCHEVGHIALGIPADHSAPSWSYSRRPPGEIACDIFAAEVLLPYKLFKPRVDASDIGLTEIDALADEFDASTISTGSRFATFTRELCAFVLSEGGVIRYAARSTSLRQAKGWIRPGTPIPKGTYTARLRSGEAPTGREEAEPDLWFEDWEGEGTLYEDARHLSQWDQTLTLLWFDEDGISPPAAKRGAWDKDTYGLRELDGNLPWPGKRRRR